MKTVLLFSLLSLFTFPFFAQTQLGQDIDGEAEGDQSSLSIDLSADGTIAAIGARFNDGNGDYSGHVRIFGFNGTFWQQMGDDIDGEAEIDTFGHSVSLSANGTIVAVGAPGNDANGEESGHVRVFEYNGAQWQQIGNDIEGEAAYDRSGRSVSLSANGTILAIGAPGNDGNASALGHVRVFEYDGVQWQQLGNDIDGEEYLGFFGNAVDLSTDGNILAVGAYANDGNGFGSGHVRVFEYDGAQWQQMGTDIDGEAIDDHSGISVSLNAEGNIVAIGAPGNDGNGDDSGHVRVFTFNGTNWQQLGADIDGEATFDRSGQSVDLSADGAILAIGAYGNDGNGEFSGHARIFRFQGTQWQQVGEDINGEAAGDASGGSVRLSADGSIVAIGAVFNGDNGESSGHVRVFGDLPLGVEDAVLVDFELYPNPAEDLLYASAGEQIKQIVIYNVLGQKVLERAPQSTLATINVSHLSVGTYLVKTTLGSQQDAQVITKKLIVYR